MSLIRRVRLLFFGSLAVMVLASLVLAVGATADGLRHDAAARNVEAAGSLARALGTSAADAATGVSMLQAVFESGAFRRIRWTDAQGNVLFDRQSASPTRAPRTFAAWAALDEHTGTDRVRHGDSVQGVVEVVGAAGPRLDRLWADTLRLAAALASLAAGLVVLGVVVTGRLGRELDRAIAHAESLQQGDYQPAVESRLPEMRRLSRAVTAMAGHVRQVFDAHTAQLDLLRMEATRDPLTGLLNRNHFLHELELAARRAPGTAGGGLVLLRLLDIATVNRTLGHPATDGVIRVIAQSLQAYTRRVDGCRVGRLNGSDFALLLPAPGLAGETAQALLEVLGAALPALGSGVAVVAGAAEADAGSQGAALLKAADAALRCAQRKGPFESYSESPLTPEHPAP